MAPQVSICEWMLIWPKESKSACSFNMSKQIEVMHPLKKACIVFQTIHAQINDKARVFARDTGFVIDLTPHAVMHAECFLFRCRLIDHSPCQKAASMVSNHAASSWS